MTLAENITSTNQPHANAALPSDVSRQTVRAAITLHNAVRRWEMTRSPRDEYAMIGARKSLGKLLGRVTSD